MSKLYLSEGGNVVPNLCEELTKYRRARKVLSLPRTACPATLFILGRRNKDYSGPLRLKVNQADLPAIEPASADGYCWYTVQVDPSKLLAGPNVFEFWS